MFANDLLALPLWVSTIGATVVVAFWLLDLWVWVGERDERRMVEATRRRTARLKRPEQPQILFGWPTSSSRER